jgi:hypothetical protein
MVSALPLFADGSVFTDPSRLKNLWVCKTDGFCTSFIHRRIGFYRSFQIEKPVGLQNRWFLHFLYPQTDRFLPIFPD